jgi:hypothetical protein
LLSQSIAVPPDVIFRVLDDEAVLLNLKTGTYFGLDAVGTRIWQLLTEHRSLARVLDLLLEEYDVDRGPLEQDLLALVDQLCSKGLGEIASG